MGGLVSSATRTRLVGYIEDTEDEAAWFARVTRYFTLRGVTSARKDTEVAVGAKDFRWKPFVESFGEHTEPGRSVGGRGHGIVEKKTRETTENQVVHGVNNTSAFAWGLASVDDIS